MLRPASFSLFAIALLLGACSDREATPTPAPSETRETSSAAPTGTASPSSTATTASPAARAPAGGPAEFQGDRALAHIRHLAEVIGDRVAGTASELETAEYIHEQFTNAGYEAEIRAFTFEGDRFQPATISFGERSVEALTMAGSGAGRVSGPAVFVGIADTAGIAGQDLTGKIAIADRGTLRFGDKWENVRLAGAIGLAVINTDAGELSGNLGVTTDRPVVGVALADGPALKRAAQSGEAITIQTPRGSATRAYNVLARPKAGAACLVLVGGHHDTVAGTPGAHDNASGAAETLELARAFAADGLNKGLCFATFGAEESGLHGSAALARELSAEGTLPKAMINLDTTGAGSRIELIGTAALTAEAAELARKLGITANESRLPAGTNSDHASFEAAGVAVLFLASDDFSNIHTPRDTVDTINPALLEQNGDLAFAVIGQILGRVAQG